jgi:hypothetical protein
MGVKLCLILSTPLLSEGAMLTAKLLFHLTKKEKLNLTIHFFGSYGWNAPQELIRIHATKN